MRNRLMPHFGRLRLDAIDHARVAAWFDAASANKPGAANRAFEILRAMLACARQWGDLGEHVPDACANIVRNPRRPVARYLDHAELERLGATLDRHEETQPWPVAAVRLLTLTGARLSEILNLKWDEIGEFGENGASARIEDSKTGPRTIWLGPEAARLLAALPRQQGADRLFPEDLTSARLYTFWVGVRDEAGLPGLRIHDCRHTWASQGVMNGVGLSTVGRLLGHRQRETTAIYAHLDDGALRDAAAQAAAVIARAMGYRAVALSLPDKAGHSEKLVAMPESPIPNAPALPERDRTPLRVRSVEPEPCGCAEPDGDAGPPSRPPGPGMAVTVPPTDGLGREMQVSPRPLGAWWTASCVSPRLAEPSDPAASPTTSPLVRHVLSLFTPGFRGAHIGDCRLHRQPRPASLSQIPSRGLSHCCFFGSCTLVD